MNDEPCQEAVEARRRIETRSKRLSEAEATVKAYIAKLRIHRGPLNDTDATLLALAELVMDARG